MSEGLAFYYVFSLSNVTSGFYLVKTHHSMPSKSLVAASLKPFILSLLAKSPGYGYQIIKRVSKLTDGHVKWTTGTLYPLLHSLENDHLLESYWEEAESGPRRKFYKITDAGLADLESEKTDWLRVNGALISLWGGTLKLGSA